MLILGYYLPCYSVFKPYLPHLHRWAGLIRGAESVALVYYFFDPKGKSEDSHRATLIAATLVCVMVSIIIFGALTKTLLDLTLGPQGALCSLFSPRSLFSPWLQRQLCASHVMVAITIYGALSKPRLDLTLGSQGTRRPHGGYYISKSSAFCRICFCKFLTFLRFDAWGTPLAIPCPC